MSKRIPNNLDQAPIPQLIVKMTAPVMLAGLLTTSYGFVDMIFASRLGGVQVASVAFVTPLFMMLNAIVRGIARGGVSIIAKLIGQQDRNQAAAYATQLRLLIIAIALFFCLTGVVASHPLLKLLQISGELFDQSLIYTRIMYFSLPASAIIALYMTLFISQGKMQISTQIALLGLLCNIVMNSLSIYALSLGIDGLAYATLATNIIQCAFIVWMYHRERHDFEIGWRIESTYELRSIIVHLLRVGCPLSFSLASTSFGFMLINVLIAPFGYEVVAAFAIGNRINSLMFSPTRMIGQGVVPLIAHNWGAGALDRVRKTIKAGLLYALLCGGVGALFIHMVKMPLGTFLTKGDPVILKHALNYIGLVGWTVIPWSVFQMLQSIFESFQKTTFTVWINVFRLWGIRIPGVLLVSYLLPTLAEYGIWYTMFVSNILTLIFALVFFAIQIPGLLHAEAVAPRPAV